MLCNQARRSRPNPLPAIVLASFPFAAETSGPALPFLPVAVVSPLPSAHAREAPARETPDPARARFEADLDALVRAPGGEIGFAFTVLESGETIARNADTVFPQASLIKLPVLLELYRQEQEGGLDLSERIKVREEMKVGGEGVLQFFRPGDSSLSLRDVAALMMTISDNTAANILIGRVGMESVNRRMAAWGVPGIRLQRRMMDLEARKRGVENLAAPRDMMRLLAALHRGELLDAERTRAALALMEKIQGSPLSRRLPAGARAPHKDGNLEGIRTGAGLLLLDGRAVAWALMARGLPDEAAGEEALARILRAAYDYFSAR